MRRTSSSLELFVLWVAVAGCCLPQTALAAQPADRPSSVVTDVALQNGGVLLGQVVDPQGSALSAVSVSLHSGDQQLGANQTDGSGYFVFRGLRGGTYQLVAAKGHGVFRAWAPGTAPPSAQQGALLVAGEETVRGQFGQLKFWLSNPWVIAGFVTAAVAIPVALYNTGEKKSASP